MFSTRRQTYGGSRGGSGRGLGNHEGPETLGGFYSTEREALADLETPALKTLRRNHERRLKRCGGKITPRLTTPKDHTARPSSTEPLPSSPTPAGKSSRKARAEEYRSPTPATLRQKSTPQNSKGIPGQSDPPETTPLWVTTPFEHRIWAFSGKGDTVNTGKATIYREISTFCRRVESYPSIFGEEKVRNHMSTCLWEMPCTGG